jgi:hypothetical protein
LTLLTVPAAIRLDLHLDYEEVIDLVSTEVLGGSQARK